MPVTWNGSASPCICCPKTITACAGIKHEWDLELYGRLLETGGGKERMTAYFTVSMLLCRVALLQRRHDCSRTSFWCGLACPQPKAMQVHYELRRLTHQLMTCCTKNHCWARETVTIAV